MNESEVNKTTETTTDPENIEENTDANNSDQTDEQEQQPNFEAMYNDTLKELTELRKYVILFQHNVDVTKDDYDKIIKMADKLVDENTDFATAVEMVKKMFPGCQYKLPRFSYPVGGRVIGDSDGFKKAFEIGG